MTHNVSDPNYKKTESYKANRLIEKNQKKEVAKKMGKKAPCMNCGSMQNPKDIDYNGDEKWICPSCKGGSNNSRLNKAYKAEDNFSTRKGE